MTRGGVRAGCIEALFCLGDKPEIAYRAHREWLAQRGLRTTAEYLVQACEVAFEIGMLPHTNAGILRREEMERLQRVNASLGLMLEIDEPAPARARRRPFLGPRQGARRAHPHARGGRRARDPLHERHPARDRRERRRARRHACSRSATSADRLGHIQEVIVQPFHPKPDTRMRDVPALGDAEVAGWVAMARLLLGPAMNVQAPPNLAPDALELLLRSGLNDWGGVSPVTVDFINPEAPWPTLRELARRTAAAGQRLVERLPVYPEHLLGRPELFDPRVRAAALREGRRRGLGSIPARPDSQVEAA